MYIDSQQTFSWDQSVILDLDATVDSENVVNMKVAKMGEGSPLPMFLQVTEDVETGGTAYLQFDLLTDSGPTFSDPAVLYSTGPIETSTLVKGWRASIKDLPNGAEQYLKWRVTNSGAATTAGKISAAFAVDINTI